VSEDFKCENCSTVERRHRGHLVPYGWLYAEVTDFDTGQIIVIGICSASCLLTFFKPGPGKLTDATRKESDVDQRRDS
jgi:hypothetical protein